MSHIDLMNNQRQIVLASGSPRRLELMRGLGFEPTVFKSDVPEEIGPDEAPAAYALRLSEEKGEAVRSEIFGRDDVPGGFILAADTIVELDGEVLEKPSDADDAFRMIKQLSDTVHNVVTAFYWVSRDGQKRHSEAVTTKVRFRSLDDDTIRRYVASGEPMDKAGAYGIQGLASVLVDGIEGSYTCVVGLPLTEVVASLRELGGVSGFPFKDDE